MKNNTKNIRKGITATLFAAVMIASVLVVVPVVSATVTVYPNDRPGWESALCCGYEEESFTDAILNPGVSVVSEYPGYVDTVKGVWWDNLICPGETGGPTTTTWQFDTPLYGFGGNWNPGVPSGPGSRIAVAIDGSWVSIGEIPETYIDQFWGFVSTEPFNAVLLSSGSLCSGTPWCEKYELDHMVYAQDTTPPVITCPADVTVEQETADGTEVSLTATATDICDADPTITSDELAIYPLGMTTVTFTATDDSGNSATCTTMVTVEDKTPPEITCPADVTVEQESAAGTVVSLTATATDICDAAPVITSDELAIYPLGTTTVTFTATDNAGNTASCTTTVTVVDTIAPDISVTVSPDTLWPPNHKMVDITAAVTVNDICDAAPTVVLTSVTSDEPDNAIGIGDGNTVNDIQDAEIGAEDYAFKLRAERAGTGDGRVYTITYTVTDASGNSASAFATVEVPHDMD